MALSFSRSAARRRPRKAIRLSRESLVGWALLGLVCLLAAYPVVLMFIKSFSVAAPGQPPAWGLDSWTSLINERGLGAVFANTFSLAAIRTAISVAIAIFFAWIVTRTDAPARGLIEIMLWLGFFLPVLPMTLGWVLLLDPSYGLINHFAMDVLGFGEAPFNVFSYWGIVWCQLAFSVSIRFLLLTPAFRSMDAALEEAARMSGSNSWVTLLRINIPVLAPAIFASVALGFIKSLESFEIEWVLGPAANITVVSTKLYAFLNWEPPYYGRATALSGIFLLTIFLLIWLQKILLRNRDYTTMSGRGFSTRPVSLGVWRWPATVLCLAFVAITIVVPFCTLLMGTFMNVFGFFDLAETWTLRNWVETVEDPLFFKGLYNTILLAGGVTVIGVLFYALVSYGIVRTRFVARSAIDFFSWLPWALPGVLLSLGLLWVVLGTGGIFRFMYGTIFVLIISIVVKEMPLGTQMIKAGTVQISRDLEEASKMSGATWIMTFRRVMLPLLRPSLVAVGIVMFIVSVREISAIVFLASSNSKTLSLLMMDYISDQSMEKATVVGVFTVFMTLGLLLVGSMCGLSPRGKQ